MPLVVLADPGGRVAAAAKATFAQMPDLVVIDGILGTCGADRRVLPIASYCTSQNTIFAAAPDIDAAYFIAHAYGHAVQVQHGVADVALREIRSRPDDELMLRGWVERQVDCIAGFLLAEAGLDLPLLEARFVTDPLDRPHWGRDPLRLGPHVAVSPADRAEWLRAGYEGGLSACAVGEFGPELLLSALRR